MKKGIIIYRSKYGSTEKYATWLSESTGFAAIEAGQASEEILKDKDIVIYAGGLYATGISGLNFIKKNIGLLKGKKLIIFACGATPYGDEVVETVRDNNLNGNLEFADLFYGRGAWDLNKMNFLDRNLCKLLKNRVSKKDPANYEIWEKALMSAGDESCDWTDKKYLDPVIRCIDEYCNS